MPVAAGRAFDLVALANVTPDRISVTGRGLVDRRTLMLDSAAVLTREGDGWRMAPTRVRFGGGRATLSGRTGSSPEVRADLQAMPLQLLDIGWPDLGLGGIASGRLDYRWHGANGLPSGRADLKVRGLSRAGLVLSSRPIDVGLAAVLEGGKAALRAVAVSDGKTIGRAQARFAPLGRGPIIAELVNAPMQMQVRYSGPADTLWRLSGVEIIDLERSGRDRRRHQRTAGRSDHPRLDPHRRRADRKRGDRHGGRRMSPQPAASADRGWCSTGSPG